MNFKAFTLAELLIALAVLGVIATFTIPKVLTAQADADKKAKFREFLSTVSQLQQQILLTNPTVSPYDYFKDNMNYRSTSVDGVASINDNGQFNVNSGYTIYAVSSNPATITGNDWIVFSDNKDSQQICVIMNYSNGTLANASYPVPKGQIGPCTGGTWTSNPTNYFNVIGN